MRLTAKQAAFCEHIAAGKTQADSYRAAYDASSMKDSTVWARASELMAYSKVAGRVEELRAALAKKELWTRERSIKKLIKALNISKKDRNASGMINAIKELNAMHGFNAPEKIDLTTNGESFKPMIITVSGPAGGDNLEKATAILLPKKHLSTENL